MKEEKIEEKVKAWEKLLESGIKLTIFNQNEESQLYPLRKLFRPSAPNIVKPALQKDFEIGLVYPIDKNIEEIREKCGLDRIPPTAHSIKESLYNKIKIIEEAGIKDELMYDKEKKKFYY
jgi:heterodisulfide reductase subunit C